MTTQDLTDYVKLLVELVKLVPHLLSLATYCCARWNAAQRREPREGATSYATLSNMTNQTPRGIEAERKALGQIISKARIRMGWNKTDLIKATGLNSKTLASIETGERGALDANLVKIENAFGWPSGAIAGIKESLSRGVDPEWERYITNKREEAESSSPKPAARASMLTDEELMTELTYRMLKYGRERR